MLHEFLRTNRAELIHRCQGKAATRWTREITPAAIDGGVAVFLRHTAVILQNAAILQSAASQPVMESEDTFSVFPIGRDASRHAMKSLRRGFRIDEVVREYGDVCQATTELAIEQKAPITVNEFRIFNLCLDEAVAGAVSPYSMHLLSPSSVTSKSASKQTAATT